MGQKKKSSKPKAKQNKRKVNTVKKRHNNSVNKSGQGKETERLIEIDPGNGVTSIEEYEGLTFNGKIASGRGSDMLVNNLTSTQCEGSCGLEGTLHERTGHKENENNKGDASENSKDNSLD